MAPSHLKMVKPFFKSDKSFSVVRKKWSKKEKLQQKKDTKHKGDHKQNISSVNQTDLVSEKNAVGSLHPSRPGLPDGIFSDRKSQFG
jgi:hypothetical protein